MWFQENFFDMSNREGGSDLTLTVKNKICESIVSRIFFGCTDIFLFIPSLRAFRRAGSRAALGSSRAASDTTLGVASDYGVDLVIIHQPLSSTGPELPR